MSEEYKIVISQAGKNTTLEVFTKDRVGGWQVYDGRSRQDLLMIKRLFDNAVFNENRSNKL